jgi:hypothetical protein
LRSDAAANAPVGPWHNQGPTSCLLLAPRELGVRKLEATQGLVIISTTSPLVTRNLSIRDHARIFCNAVGALVSISTPRESYAFTVIGVWKHGVA